MVTISEAYTSCKNNSDLKLVQYLPGALETQLFVMAAHRHVGYFIQIDCKNSIHSNPNLFMFFLVSGN